MSFFIDGGDGGGARALGPVRLASLVGERWTEGFKCMLEL